MHKLSIIKRLLARKRQVNSKNATQSNQYFEVRTKLQKYYKRVTNIQNDLLHKFTTEIYHNYDTVVIEDLDVKAMQMSKKAKNLIVHCSDVLDCIWNIKPKSLVKTNYS